MTYSNKFVAVVKSKGKVLRERKNNTVYIPFGSEYSILLKNLNSQRALVKITIDGKSIGADLIVNGGSSHELERFIEKLDKGNKFKFIQKTKRISNYRGDRVDDGIIRIEVFFESVIPMSPWSSWTYIPYTYIPYYTYTYTNSSSTPYIPPTTVVSSQNFAKPNPNEGITVKGSESNQQFVYGSIGTLEPTSDVIIFYLSGYSEQGKKIEKQAITVKTKLVCSTCGKHNKSIHKFCSKCGTFLQ